MARIVAEWSSLDERLIFQSVSHIISFHLEVKLSCGVWDSLEDGNWTLPGNGWERYCYEAQGNAF